MRAKAGKDDARILRITLATMNFYRDFAYPPRSCAICLFINRPVATKCHDPRASPRRQRFETNLQLCHSSFLLKPRSIAGMTELKSLQSKSCSRNGFVRNSIAPPFIACTDIGMSPWPGDEDNRQLSFGHPASFAPAVSSPLWPGSRTSSTRQSGSFWEIRRAKFRSPTRIG